MVLQPLPHDPRQRPWGTKDRELGGYTASAIKRTMSEYTENVLVIEPWWPQRPPEPPPMVKKGFRSLGFTILIAMAALAIAAVARAT